jgi:hypothetical protein
MPKFYFNVRTNDCFEEDIFGSELQSLEAARDEAFKAAREMVAEKVLAGALIDEQRFEIVGEDGAVLLEVPFMSALRLE